MVFGDRKRDAVYEFGQAEPDDEMVISLGQDDYGIDDRQTGDPEKPVRPFPQVAFQALAHRQLGIGGRQFLSFVDGFGVRRGFFFRNLVHVRPFDFIEDENLARA